MLVIYKYVKKVNILCFTVCLFLEIEFCCHPSSRNPGYATVVPYLKWKELFSMTMMDCQNIQYKHLITLFFTVWRPLIHKFNRILGLLANNFTYILFIVPSLNLNHHKEDNNYYYTD